MEAPEEAIPPPPPSSSPPPLSDDDCSDAEPQIEVATSVEPAQQDDGTDVSRSLLEELLSTDEPELLCSELNVTDLDPSQDDELITATSDGVSRLAVEQLAAEHDDDQSNYSQFLPDDVLGECFAYLELNERVKAAQVCDRWNELLTGGRHPIDNVVVLNLFQRDVWLNNIRSGGGGVKIQCVSLRQFDHFPNALAHIASSSSVKLWFSNQQFVRDTLDSLRERRFRLRCLDVYPYADTPSLDVVAECWPQLSSLTLRPHGTDFFWEGLNLAQFPDFPKLDTLLLDSVNLGENAILPQTLTTFEWTNRKESRFKEFLPKLTSLVNLEYLLLGHVDFTETSSLAGLESAINVSNMPRLQFLVFRFCKFPEKVTFFMNDSEKAFEYGLPLTNLKVLKLDLCYGCPRHTVTEFLSVTGDAMRIVSINCIYEEFEINSVYDLTSQLERRKVSLHFGLLQKGTRPLGRVVSREAEAAARTAASTVFPPLGWRNVIWKLDMSFLADTALMLRVMSGGIYGGLTEMKYVQCDAITDELLEIAARCCPRMRKLSLLNCDGVTNNGVKHFIRHFPSRRSPSLLVIWKRKSYQPASFYLDICMDRELLAGLKTRFVAKRLPGAPDAARVIVWEKLTRKALLIQDYGDTEKHRIMGFSIPCAETEDSIVDDGPTLSTELDGNIADESHSEDSPPKAQIE